MLQSNGAASFTRSLGTSGTTFQITANGGVFHSANTGQLTVNIGGAGAQQVWGSTVGTNLVGTLQFGSTPANKQTLFQNGIDLNGANRTINVTGNTTANSGDSDVISGVIVNSNGTAGLTVTGNAPLTLTGSNTYNGSTTINTNAILQANDGVGLPTGSFLSLNGGVLQSNGAASFTRGLGPAVPPSR